MKKTIAALSMTALLLGSSAVFAGPAASPSPKSAVTAGKKKGKKKGKKHAAATPANAAPKK